MRSSSLVDVARNDKNDSYSCQWPLLDIGLHRRHSPRLTDRSYAIPFYALALNLAWELLHVYLGLRATIDLQTIINTVWFLFDVGILHTYFRYGKKYFPANLASWFVPWSILGLFTAFWVEYAFVREFGTFAGGAFSGPNFFILVIGILCSVFDLIYIWMLFSMRPPSDHINRSSVHPRHIRELRELTRYRESLVREQTRRTLLTSSAFS